MIDDEDETPKNSARRIVRELLPELPPERATVIVDEIDRAIGEWMNLAASVEAQSGER